MLTFTVMLLDTNEQPPKVLVGQVAGNSMSVYMERIVESILPEGGLPSTEDAREGFIYEWIEEHYLVSAPQGSIKKYDSGSVVLYEVDYDGDEIALPKASYCEHAHYARGRCAVMTCWNYVSKHAEMRL